MLVSVEEAREMLAGCTVAWGTEIVPLSAAAGRVLRQAIVADRDQPPFDRVAMDGIAIAYATYAGGLRDFPVAWLQAAGDEPMPLADATHCVEIMTGAALPQGTDTVIRYEDLQRSGTGFRLPEGVVAGVNIHGRAKDTRAGTVLAEAGRRIGVAEVGMLATCGYADVEVARLPRVAVVATGNELVPVAATPAPHQIRRSNYYQLRSLLEPLGIEADLFHCSDDRPELKEQLGRLLASHDLLILSGGVSKGKLDFVPEVLRELGVAELFHGVAQRPGKPLWVGQKEETVVFGLPGNPVSSISCALHYVVPFIRANLGLPPPATRYARLTEEVRFAPALTLWQRVSLRSDGETGAWLATPVHHAGSGDAGSMLRTDAFAHLPAAQSVFAAGTVVTVVPLP